MPRVGFWSPLHLKGEYHKTTRPTDIRPIIVILEVFQENRVRVSEIVVSTSTMLAADGNTQSHSGKWLLWCIASQREHTQLYCLTYPQVENMTKIDTIEIFYSESN